MPGIGGLELAAHTRGTCPRAKVLLISGSERRDAIPETHEGEECEFLAKPFDAHQLVERIKRLVDEGE